MTLDELSIQFDIMYNNISSNQAPGLTEYEKSVFLTQAQDAIILELYKGVYGNSFETTEEVTRYLNSLVSTFESTSLSEKDLDDYKTFECVLPSEAMFILYQKVKIDNKDVIAVPSKLDSLFKDLNNPFKRSSKNRVLVTYENNKVIIYSNDNVSSYLAKYLEYPYPILLSDDEGFTIRGKTSQEIDWIPESLQNQILIRAVQMAKTVWAS
jgi:hypothetical protein